MNTHNTLYIAEPIFSELLQKYDPVSSFPPVKKIGITTNHPERREKELLGTVSPVKISIVKAWTNIDARAVEKMLHSILDNSRLDGEYFWDGNETLIDSVTNFISTYHSDAEEIIIDNEPDVKAASESVNKKYSLRIYEEVVPFLENLNIKYKIKKGEKDVRFKLNNYNLLISCRSGGRYTLTIWSKSKSTEEALTDFPESQEISAAGTEDSDRKARIPMEDFEKIKLSLKHYKKKTPSNSIKRDR